MRVKTRIKVFLVAATFTSFATGFHGIKNAIKYPHPVQLSFSEYQNQHPDEGWYSIPDAQLDIANSIPKEGTLSAYYVPIIVPGVGAQPALSNNISTASTDSSRAQSGISSGPPDTYHLVAYITNDKLVQQIDAYNNAHNRPMTPNGMLHGSQLQGLDPNMTITLPVKGMALTADSQKEEDIANISEKLGTQYPLLFINFDKKPSALMGFVFIGGGILMAIGAMWSFGLNPSVSGTKELIQSARGGGYGSNTQPYSTPYANNISTPYVNNQWNQNQQHSSNNQQQPGSPFPPAVQPGAPFPPAVQPGAPYPTAISNEAAPTLDTAINQIATQ